MIHSKKVMQLLQRLHDKDSIEGTGIGLSICTKIIKMHQGNLSINSGENQGTKVYLTFPMNN